MTATTTETGFEQHGLAPTGVVLRNPTTSQLYTDAIRRGDGRLAEGGPLVVDTGRFTGRSPDDKFVVREPGPRSGSGGATSTARSTSRASTACVARSRTTSPLRSGST